jgi:hypothetical protein
MVIWGAFLLLAAGCATSPEPFEYVPETEFKQGPGLLSGEDGMVHLYPWGGLPGIEEKVGGATTEGEPAAEKKP